MAAACRGAKKSLAFPVSPIFILITLLSHQRRFCGLVVRVPGYRAIGLGSISVLPDFLRSSGSGLGSTQPHEYN
jgi:hypothetical protein